MSTWTTSDISSLSIAGVTDVERDTIIGLLKAWNDRLEKNQRRSLYYDGEQAFKDLGLMLPPQLKNAKFYLGWATMAVRKLASMSQFEGLRLPGSEDPFELGEVFEANRFGLEFSQGVTSAYKHGVSFATVAKGAPGEPSVQIQTHSAEHSSALWDARRRAISAALTITDTRNGKPSAFIVYLPNVVLHCHLSERGVWATERTKNPIGRTLAVAITYDPQLGKPFGRSRITNPVMSLTDMAVRAYVRMEGNAEFYSSPQVAIEGIDAEAFDGDPSSQKRFKLAMDRLIALTRDADGHAPNIKQLQQATMAPHSDMLRTVAMAFSGETGIPPASLGIIHDNPSSAEAIRANKHDLLVDATFQNKYVLGTAVRDIASLAVMVRDGLNEPPADMWQLSAKFADPEFRSTSANADSYVKLASANPALAQSQVLLETVFDDDQVKRIQSDVNRSAITQLVQNISANRGPNAQSLADSAEGALGTGSVAS